jgi:hypothetical protein
VRGTTGRRNDDAAGLPTGRPGDDAAGTPVGRQAASGEVRDGVPTETTTLAPKAQVPDDVAALAVELLGRAEQDRELMRQAQEDPAPLRRHRIAQCHRDNAEALAAIVARYGWPHADLVGSPASTAAVMILLHSPDLGFRLRCRDLIALATADGHTPAIHFAYVADQCAVDLGQPQYYGTRISPRTLRPYPIRHPQSVDERRSDVGLGPLQEQLQALRITG